MHMAAGPVPCACKVRGQMVDRMGPNTIEMVDCLSPEADAWRNRRSRNLRDAALGGLGGLLRLNARKDAEAKGGEEGEPIDSQL